MAKSNPYITTLLTVASIGVVVGGLLWIIGFDQSTRGSTEVGVSMMASGGALFGFGALVSVAWLVVGAVTWRAPVEEPATSEASAD